MVKDGYIHIKTLQAFLFDLKSKALDLERRASGSVKEVMVSRIQYLDSLLIYLSSRMEEPDMAKLTLTTTKTPIPLKQVKTESEQQAALTEALKEAAESLEQHFKKLPKPESITIPLDALGDLKVKSVASKMWTLRADSRLPKNIVPILEKGKLYMAYKTDEEIAKMRKGKGK